MTMPDFLIIGIAKSGSTSVFAYLTEHPQIHKPPIKEPDFFEWGEPEKPPHEIHRGSERAVQSLEAYQALFADVPPGKLCGEASVSNMNPRACERIQQYLPNAKLICLLRQPVDRAYSAYAMHAQRGSENMPDFRRAYLDKTRYGKRKKGDERPNYALMDASWYVKRLEDWFSRFSRDQIYIGIYDDLKKDSTAFMCSLYGFLGVDQSFIPQINQIHNRSYGTSSVYLSWFLRLLVTRSRIHWPGFIYAFDKKVRIINRKSLAPLDPAVRRELTIPQHEDIQRLQDLIGRDLSHWLV